MAGAGGAVEGWTGRGGNSMGFAVGSLVRARGREWVVLPDSADDLLVLRPLGGADDEIAGILPALESVASASFDLPDPTRPGDARSARLLRDAVRLGFRSSAGPFRSVARIAVEPRPYQLVPLLMALKLDPVRLLIADDVGVGKTVEAALVARELLDRAEARRLAVLCPPHLAPQWQAELRDKFHIEAELVLPGTATRLERGTGLGQSLFDVYPFTVVPLDFIKSERRRNEFLRACPELVIVDEAHTCADAVSGRGSAHQRHQLVADLAQDDRRHMLFVTATPHSGNETAFRSLLALLHSDFVRMPEEGERQDEALRRRLAAHFVQRRRADIRRYLDADTPFPTREDRQPEPTYRLTPAYQAFFDRVLRYARESVADPSGGGVRQRVRWWSALALLRSIGSSPAAAAATLRNRAAADVTTVEEADAIGRRTLFDQVEEESAEGADLTPGGDPGAEESGETGERRRLLALAREAEGLLGPQDAKLQGAVALVEELLADGFRPIVFCRFIPTAEYLADELRRRLKGIEVQAVTGLLPADEREDRVAALAEAPRHVLVATDCLSEGINLQEHFDAVLHYDLSWNPTRHEQREGRVDRYGQASPVVRVLTYYGANNPIDGIVLDVLLRKHKAIRDSLGVSVPAPVDTDEVVEAIVEGLLVRGRDEGIQATLPGFDAVIKPKRDELFSHWDRAADRERRSRTRFAQEGIRVEEVAAELAAAQGAVGAGADIAAFMREALRLHGAQVSDGEPLRVNLREAPLALRDALGEQTPTTFRARFSPPVQAGELLLNRTHPLVETLAAHTLDGALDPLGASPARRCGAIRTGAVERRTTLLLLRYRFHLLQGRGAATEALLAEDCALLAFAGAPSQAEWLSEDQAVALLAAGVDANISAEQATAFISRVTEEFAALTPAIAAEARRRGDALLTAHQRVRAASRLTGSYRVEPQLPADVLGIYCYLPSGR